MEADQSIPQHDSQSNAPEDGHHIKSESLPGDSLFLTTQTLALAPTSATAVTTPSISPPIIPSTETATTTTTTTTTTTITNGTTEETSATAAMPAAAGKKKGTAAPSKKGSKRTRNGPKSKKSSKKIKPEPASSRATPAGSSVAGDDDASDGSGSDEESDHGPYCICRGPDDHRWMICCEKCEDWFHGECIKLDKGIGESLIEKFICPNCTDDTITTLYKKTCALGGCRKASRLSDKSGPVPVGDRSVFCSNDHAAVWWERLVARLPKGGKTKAGLSDQLTQDEFMALLSHGLIGMDDEGSFRPASTPFKGMMPDGKAAQDDNLVDILTAEEKLFLDNAANCRSKIAQETVLCHQMLKLIEFAQERQRNAARAAKEDCCGYDSRLDSISSRDAFALFIKSEEGQAILEAGKLTDAAAAGTGPDAEANADADAVMTNGNVNGAGATPGGSLFMCERKRCKTHGGWQKILVTGVRQQIKEMEVQAAELVQEENIVREAAWERHLRKKAESNWVEVIEG